MICLWLVRQLTISLFKNSLNSLMSRMSMQHCCIDNCDLLRAVLTARAPSPCPCVESTEIPIAFAENWLARGRTSWEIVHGNPWKKPPPEVVDLGPEAVVTYLQDMDTFGSTLSNRLKIVLVGLENAGKTSIAIRLQRGTAAALPRSEERTVGVEIRDIEMGPNPASRGKGPGLNLAVKLWDFAGQRTYYDTHQVSALALWLAPSAVSAGSTTVRSGWMSLMQEDAFDGQQCVPMSRRCVLSCATYH